MSEHLMNNSGSITFTPLQLKLIRIGLVYLKNDFDEEDLELVGYTEEEMHKKLNFFVFIFITTKTCVQNRLV